MKRNNYKNDSKRKSKSQKSDRWTDKNEYRSKHDECKGKFNDPSWYKKIPGAAMAARKGFTRPVGRPFSSTELGLPFGNAAANGSSYPGICVLHYIPAVGKTDGEIQSPIDKAANKIWMDFRTKNTGGITYDAVDVILNLVAGVNIHAFYYEMTRLYGLLHNSMIVKNDYIPKELIKSLGYSYSNFMDNIAEFGIWLNTISNYINSTVHIPKTLTLYDRYVFMNAGVYKDEDLDKFQIYAFKCDGYFKFEERVEGEPGKLIFSKLGSDLTFNDVKEYFNDMWNRYALSESMADIQSGYYKFFGDSAFHVIPTVDLNYIVEPIYSEDMMKQVQNVVCWGPVVESGTEIAQSAETGFVDATYEISASDGTLSDALPEGIIMNLFINEPTEDDVLEASRGMSTCYGVSMAGSGATREVTKYIATCGSEIFTTIDLVSAYYDSNGEVDFEYITGLTTFPVAHNRTYNGATTRVTTTPAWTRIMDAFSYHPTMYAMGEATGGDNLIYLYCDIANAVVMHEDELKRINELVIISQFTIT